jgi:hypothetical protein
VAKIDAAPLDLPFGNFCSDIGKPKGKQKNNQAF